ncbi:natural killer cells antigen CD94-like isoform X2 [Epinephelus fuscoguttatus]|uniref:natural killer cells antigen CD94-like isoform X2 n=2 Tax=Epinephelus fuscoguttatus TaxID=293821 RepID=UPI0020D06EDC|nr:natural killer cells antigen CD94-like isoform X2 [Epinephelus fuscoguttatus]
MSFNIYEDPNLNMNVRYCKGARDDGGDKVERLVDIYESVDADHPVCTRDEGAHTQKHLAAVQRNPLRTAAQVLGLLCLLLVAAVIVLTTLYISITLEKDHLQSNYEEVQSSYNNLSKSFCHIQGTESQTQGNITEWERFRCSCYYKSTERKTWTESRRDCQERGADLVILNNKEEHEFVRKHRDSWIGLHSVKKSGWGDAWEWVDGSVTQYRPWHQGVTVNPKDRVGLTAYIDLEGTWRHTKTGSKRWICERQIY